MTIGEVKKAVALLERLNDPRHGLSLTPEAIDAIIRFAIGRLAEGGKAPKELLASWSRAFPAFRSHLKEAGSRPVFGGPSLVGPEGVEKAIAAMCPPPPAR